MTTFRVSANCHPQIGNAGIPEKDRSKYYATLCFSTEPDPALERGTGHYYCDLHLSRSQLKELIERGQRFFELNP